MIRNHVDEFLGGRGDGSGVRITLRKFLPGGEPACRAEVSALSLPASGQSVNGDGFFADRSECRLLLGVFDGLGHGPGAHEVSQRLQKTFAAGRGWDLETLLPRCQKAIEGTRGAAFAAVRIDLATGAGTFAGIGNVETRWMGSASKVSFVPHAGILGRAGQAVRVDPFRLKPPGTLLMVSDGISLRALEEHFERAGASGATALASRLVHEAGRAHDDRTAVVARLNPNAARKE
ncbi:MAG: serine/threonine-protein phosphatase [Planctomycetes bacterium]|nr:serine/threonine-protein phosphatase [Planctomycetota bacterium]